MIPVSDQAPVSKTPTYHLPAEEAKTVCVADVLSVVEPKRLFVKVSEQMKGIDRNIGSAYPAFQETREILHAIGMDLAVDVALRVVNHPMCVFAEPS